MMGRLFWKFFSIFWPAQVVTSVGVGIAVWMAPLASAPASNIFLAAPLLPIVAGSLVSLPLAALLTWYFARPPRTLPLSFDTFVHRTRRIADAHGGCVSASNRPEGGLLVALELPFAHPDGESA